MHKAWSVRSLGLSVRLYSLLGDMLNFSPKPLDSFDAKHLQRYNVDGSIIRSGLHFWRHWFNIWSTAAGYSESCVWF